jgi:hypothetical protein
MRLLPFPTCAEYDFLGMILSGSEGGARGTNSEAISSGLNYGQCTWFA